MLMAFYPLGSKEGECVKSGRTSHVSMPALSRWHSLLWVCAEWNSQNVCSQGSQFNLGARVGSGSFWLLKGQSTFCKRCGIAFLYPCNFPYSCNYNLCIWIFSVVWERFVAHSNPHHHPQNRIDMMCACFVWLTRSSPEMVHVIN